jgi:L-malate glycosyltransferase
MKILISLHELVVGGTTLNCIELATALRDRHGHEVLLFATPGPMLKWVQDAGLRFVPAPVALRHPSPARMQALRALVRLEKPDLVHAWEPWPCLDAYCGVHWGMGLPLLVTDMQMDVTRLTPKRLPTTYGTPELVAKALAAGRQRAELLLPPVDIHLNAPGAVDAAAAVFAQQFGIQPGDITLVTVSRLAASLKGESLFRSIDAVRLLAAEGGRASKLRLLIVGDGSDKQRVAQHAAQANAALGRQAIVLTGAMHDPRPAYAAADIVIGMGGSALRAAAFAKPVLVVGEQAFSAPLTPASAPLFHHIGLYGLGDGDPQPTRMLADLRGLVQRPEDWPALGRFSRQFVVQHFSLEAVSAQLSGICGRAVVPGRSRLPGLPKLQDALRTAAVYLRERRFLWRGLPPAPMESVDG